MRRLTCSVLLSMTFGLLACTRAPQPLATRTVAAGVQNAPNRSAATPADLKLPNVKDSVKFVAMGDNGTGDASQYETAKQMVAWREKFPYDFVIMLGDNLYGSQEPQDFVTKFETPYKPLLDAGVKFYAALGNHDAREQRFYKLFNMEGKLYYAYAPKPNI